MECGGKRQRHAAFGRVRRQDRALPGRFALESPSHIHFGSAINPLLNNFWSFGRMTAEQYGFFPAF